jgi:hypothetical protein
MFSEIGRWLIVLGGMIVLIGLLLLALGRLPGSWRLPGDLVIERGDFTCFAPLGTMLLLSIILTLVANLLIRLFR